MPPLLLAAPSARPFGIYYGWWVVSCLFLSGMAVYGAGLYGFTLFVAPLTDEFGWNRASTVGLVSVFWLSAPLSLLAGTLNSRFGPLKLICFGIVLEAGCLVLLGLVSELWHMYVLRGLMGVGKVLVAITLPVIISCWFKKRFGMASALAYAGWHFGGLTVAPIAQWLILSVGWREACFYLGGLIFVFGLGPVISVLRVSSPKELGVNVDGDELKEAPASDSGRLNASKHVDRWMLVAHLSSPIFWLITVGTFLAVTAYSGLLTHQATIVREAGLSPVLAGQALGLTAGCAFIGALSVGWFVDRLKFKNVIAIDLGLMFCGVIFIVALTMSASPIFLFASVVTFGLAVGGFDVALVAHLRHRYSDAIFPHIFGIIYFVMLATLFLGPIFIGHLYDLNSSYTFALLLIACVLPLALLAFLMLPPIRPTAELR